MEDILKVDYAFYADKYKGSQTEAEISDALDRAAINIFIATYCRTKASKLTPFQTQMAKMAICAEADYLATTNDVNELDGITAYSIGDVSISFDTSRTQAKICDKARSYLLPTGLLNRCLW